MVHLETWRILHSELADKGVTLVAVSKTKPVEDIRLLYDAGQRDFGENYVQELTEKQPLLPADTQWHFIGHLQTNKVKYIAPFVHLVHTVDSFRLLTEIDRCAARNNRCIDVLLQVYIAAEETKFGLDITELAELMKAYKAQKEQFGNVRICGLMGMATNTQDIAQVRREFQGLKTLFDQLKASAFAGADSFRILSMGMSADYHTAVEAGSNMVRIGSIIFGSRQQPVS